MHDNQRFPQQETDRKKFGPLLGALTIAAAGVVYYLTGHPLLAAILPWLHGGWNTFLTGLWILRTDPLRSRARTCFLFYLAAACVKAAITAIAMFAVLIWAATHFGVKPDETEFIATILAFFAGLVMNSLIGVIAVAAALTFGVRVWVQTSLRTTLRGDLSQASRVGPSPPCRIGQSPLQAMNLGVIVVITALIVPAILISTGVTTIATMNRTVDGPEVFLWVSLLVGSPILTIPFCVRFTSRVVARSPQECWPDGTC